MVRTTFEMARRPAGLAAALAFLVPVLGCEDPLEVNEPEFLTPAGTSAELLVNGAIGDFQVGYSGGGLDDEFLSTSSVMSDEFISSGSFTTRTATDQRAQFALGAGNSNTSDAAYLNLQEARRAAVRAARAVQEEAGANDPRIAQMKAFEGLSIVALAEGFCSGTPLSEVTETGDLVDGPPLSTQQLFEEAIARFDQGLAVDGGNNALKVGKARALLNLGRFQEAAAAVAGVPTSFIFQIEHSAGTSRTENPIFNLQSNGRYSLSDTEGINGVNFRSAQDPRVPWVFAGGGFTPSIDLFITQKAASRASPVVVADGIEARLVEAEALLNAGDTGGWLGALNALRADVANLMSARILDYGSFVPGPNNPTTTLDPLADPGSQDARVDLHFRERAFWLHLTGHRLGDLRRLVRVYGRNPETVYPTGPYHKSGVYGNDVVMPLDFDETNNPLWSIGDCNFDLP